MNSITTLSLLDDKFELVICLIFTAGAVYSENVQLQTGLTLTLVLAF